DDAVPEGDLLRRPSEAVRPVADLADGQSDNVDAPVPDRVDQFLVGDELAARFLVEPVDPALGVDADGPVFPRARRGYLRFAQPGQAQGRARGPRGDQELTSVHASP